MGDILVSSCNCMPSFNYRHLVVSEQQSGEDWHYHTHTHTQSAEYDVLRSFTTTEE